MRLLLVEDERPLASALDDVLQEAGWVVDHATDGREGLRLALVGHYDAVVLDIMLPGLNGYDVLKNMRQSRRTRSIHGKTARGRGSGPVGGGGSTGSTDPRSSRFSGGCSPTSRSDYRRMLVAELTRRALATAMDRSDVEGAA